MYLIHTYNNRTIPSKDYAEGYEDGVFDCFKLIKKRGVLLEHNKSGATPEPSINEK